MHGFSSPSEVACPAPRRSARGLERGLPAPRDRGGRRSGSSLTWSRRLPLGAARGARDRPRPAPRSRRSPCGAPERAGHAPRARRSSARDELEALLAWCRGGRPMHAAAGALRERCPELLPAGVEGDVLARAAPRRDAGRAASCCSSRSPRTLRRRARARSRARCSSRSPWRSRTIGGCASSPRCARRREADRAALLSRLGRTRAQRDDRRRRGRARAGDGARRARRARSTCRC